ncbi:MAG TPA: hypothetical protein VIJ39_04015 [Solirubrobacteraceae bacterium]
MKAEKVSDLADAAQSGRQTGTSPTTAKPFYFPSPRRELKVAGAAKTS